MLNKIHIKSKIFKILIIIAIFAFAIIASRLLNYMFAQTANYYVTSHTCTTISGYANPSIFANVSIGTTPIKYNSGYINPGNWTFAIPNSQAEAYRSVQIIFWTPDQGVGTVLYPSFNPQSCVTYTSTRSSVKTAEKTESATETVACSNGATSTKTASGIGTGSGTYSATASSTISQLDADNKAQALADDTAQSLANAQATTNAINTAKVNARNAALAACGASTPPSPTPSTQPTVYKADVKSVISSSKTVNFTQSVLCASDGSKITKVGSGSGSYTATEWGHGESTSSQTDANNKAKVAADDAATARADAQALAIAQDNAKKDAIAKATSSCPVASGNENSYVSTSKDVARSPFVPTVVGNNVNTITTVQGVGVSGAPSIPIDFVAIPSGENSNIQLRWNDVLGADHYTIERSLDNTNWELIDDSISGNSYIDMLTSFSTKYYYRLYASDTIGKNSVPATAEVTSGAFKSNAGNGEDLTLTSDDGVFSVTIPTNALNAPANCSLTNTGLSLYTLDKYKTAFGPYVIICQLQDNQFVTTFNEDLPFELKAPKAKNYTKTQIAVYNSDDNKWQNSDVTIDASGNAKGTMPNNTVGLIVMGVPKKVPLLLIIGGSLILLIIIVLIALRIIAGIINKKRYKAKQEDYWHKMNGM